MTDVVRAKTATGDWCKPTTELPDGDLAQLLHRTRHDSTPVVRFRTPQVNAGPPRPVTYPTAPSSHTWVWPILVGILAAVAIAVAIVRPF